MNQVEKKVQVGFDIAMYSKMDMLKLERAEYECIEDTINSIKDTFNVKEDEEVPTVPEHSSDDNKRYCKCIRDATISRRWRKRKLYSKWNG